LVHGAEAILPTDLEHGSPRVRGYDEGANQRTREDSLDQLDEARTMALMHSARYQQSLRRYQARNAISQAATFVGVYEGFLGIPVNWDL
jgi:hypothetical protein